MEKLQKITEDEGRVFHSILSHEDSGKIKDFSNEKIQELLFGMRALDFDAEQVTLFCNNIKTPHLSHLDIHTRNIMKDDKGNFKLIDLDRVTLSK
jgi:thiamine kinase-like enzyme